MNEARSLRSESAGDSTDMPDEPRPLLTGDLAQMYEQDETAWLDRSVELIRQGQVGQLDWPHLVEFLQDMATNDRRKVESRLAVVLMHALKWHHQPEQRGKGWLHTILEQQRKLNLLFESTTLRNHAEKVLAKAYQTALKQAARETGLDMTAFPAECPYSVDQLLAEDLI